VKAVKVEVKPAPVVATSSKSTTTESSKSTSSGVDNGSVWGDVDQVMRSTAETEDGHASLMGMSDTQP
ncbi:hypothetical protein, partial [Pseudomonas fluorescens]|uniref:hypothetical protein n=2 Tax=Pseudomonadota TaxID=1224 RepID=UPI002B1D129F